MKPPCGRHQQRTSRRRGFTLIEVVTACLILGTLLTAILLAGGRHLRQSRIAERRLRAMELLDNFLHSQRYTQEALPPNSEGTFQEDANYIWQTTTIDQTQLGNLAITTTLVRVFRRANVERDQPLVAVKLIVPAQ